MHTHDPPPPLPRPVTTELRETFLMSNFPTGGVVAEAYFIYFFLLSFLFSFLFFFSFPFFIFFLLLSLPFASSFLPFFFFLPLLSFPFSSFSLSFLFLFLLSPSPFLSLFFFFFLIFFSFFLKLHQGQSYATRPRNLNELGPSIRDC